MTAQLISDGVVSCHLISGYQESTIRAFETAVDKAATYTVLKDSGLLSSI